MKTKLIYPSRALTPLSLLLLLLARVSLLLSLASHHCESFKDRWHTLMNWSERLEQGDNNEREIKQQAYLNSSWNNKYALLLTAIECFKHQIERRNSLLVFRRCQLASNCKVIEQGGSPKIESCRRQRQRGKLDRRFKGEIAWSRILYRLRRC
jgi:hypothetical protein